MKTFPSFARSFLTAFLLLSGITTTVYIQLAWAGESDPVVYLQPSGDQGPAGLTPELNTGNGELFPRPKKSPVNGLQSSMDVKVTGSTGALKSTFPITVPPGRSGMTPNLELEYNSYHKNDWIGVGWDLDLGSIQRSTRQGLDYSADNFEVSENGILTQLVIRPDWGPDYFGRKSERAFSKYFFAGDTNGWVVYSKNGRRYYFGTSADSRTATARGVFSWHLDRVEDPHGNYMTVSYQNDNGRLYLAEVSYAGHANSGLLPSNHVKFILANRPDKILHGRKAEMTMTGKRLSAIEVYAGSDFCRKYQFDYEQGPNSGRSRLKKITPLGADGVSALPPVLLDWHQGGKNDFPSPIQSVRSIGYPDRLGSQEVISIADVNGDARSDIVILRGGRVYHRISNGDGSFNLTGSDTIYPVGEPIGLADMNGDGLSDIVSYSRSSAGGPVYLSVLYGRGDGSYESQPMMALPGGVPEAPTYLQSNPGAWDTYFDQDQDKKLRCEVYLSDVNGDGLTDISFKYGIFFSHKINNGDGSFCALHKRFYGLVGEPLGHLDVNGDGLADYVGWRHVNSKYKYFYVNLGKGDGTYHQTIQSVAVAPNIPEEVVPLIGDYNGDGLPDVVLNRYQQCWAYTSAEDGTFKYVSMFTLPLIWANQLYFTDVTGDGVDDLVGFHDYFQASRQHIDVSISPLSASQDLLKSITDSTGASYHVDYRPSSDYFNGLLPFAVDTVATVEIDDGLGNVSRTAYTYADGLFDSENRSFAGFGHARKTLPDASYIETWFHQDEYRRGLAIRVDHLEPGVNGAILSRTTVDWKTVQLADGLSPCMFVYPDVKMKEFMDGGIVYIRERFEYDLETGNMLASETEGTDAERVTLRYAHQNYGKWLWRKTGETLESESGETLRQQFLSYEDGTGNLLQVASWLNNGENPVSRFEYDPYGNIISVTDPMGFVSSTTYDDTLHTYPVQQTNALGHTENQIYNERFGVVISRTDSNHNETLFEYDAFGRLIKSIYPDGGQRMVEFNTQTTPKAKITRTREDSWDQTVDQYEFFDGLGRKIQTVAFGENQKTIVSRIFYDAMGRIDLTEGPFFSSSVEPGWPMASPAKFPWKQVSFDFRGRPLSIESADGNYGSVVTTHRYAGYATTTIDPDGSSRTERKDYLGRIIKVVEHTGAGDFNTGYSYNAAGNLLSVIDHYGNTTSIGYDTLGRKIRMNDPDMGVWQYRYDANNNLISQTDARQQTINFVYDPLNRLISKIYSTDDPAVSYEYDNGNIPNGIGRLYSTSNSVVTTINDAYDEMGRVMRVTKSIAGAPQAFTTEFGYDLSGKQVHMRYPGGYQVTNTFYPGTNLLEKVTGSDGSEFAYLTDYEPGGKMGRIDHGNGTYTIHSYEPETEQISSIVTGRLGPSDTLQDKHYIYSKAGDITRITDGVNNAVFDYSYDKLHRLTGETSNKYEPVRYSYDAIGNITSKTVGPTSMVYFYDGAQPHAVKKIVLNGTPYDYTYDANGNMSSGPDFSNPGAVAFRNFTYNADNMALAVSRGMGSTSVVSKFVYDGDSGRAIKNSSGGPSTLYISETSELVDGELTHYVFAGNLRVAKIAGGELTYYHKDHLGSSSVTTDEYGEAINSASYRPFGGVRNPLDISGLRYGFTDQENDSEIGLYNYNARLYDPSMGRFVSADSMVPRLYNPQNLNRYSYCRNNPLLYIDPSGHYDDNGNDGDTEGFGEDCDNSSNTNGSGQDNPESDNHGDIHCDMDDCENFDDDCRSNLKGSRGEDSPLLNDLRAAAIIVSVLDCLPIGAIPGFPQVIGETIDISAAAMTQGVLVADMAHGKISTGQFVAGTVLNGLNAGLGTAGNLLTGAGNVVLSLAELGVLCISHAVTSPKEE